MAHLGDQSETLARHRPLHGQRLPVRCGAVPAFDERNVAARAGKCQVSYRNVTVKRAFTAEKAAATHCKEWIIF